MIEHWSPKPAVVGPSPATLAKMGMSSNWSGSLTDIQVMKVRVLTCPLNYGYLDSLSTNYNMPS